MPHSFRHKQVNQGEKKHHQHAYGDITLPHSKPNDSMESYGAKVYILATYETHLYK